MTNEGLAKWCIYDAISKIAEAEGREDCGDIVRAVSCLQRALVSSISGVRAIEAAIENLEAVSSGGASDG